MQIKLVGFITIVLGLGIGWSAQAQQVFVDGFESPYIEPVYPKVNGDFVLPSGPAVDQLNWVLSQLAVTTTNQALPLTSTSEITDHFGSDWDPTVASDFLATLKSRYPNGRVQEVVTITPLSVRVAIQSGDGTSARGFLSLGILWDENKKIGPFTVTYMGPDVTDIQFAEHKTMTMSETADAFQLLSPANGVLIARINPQGQCLPVVERNATTLRGAAEIVNTWVLGGVAEMVSNGTASSNQPVSLVASEVVADSELANLPLGTTFSLAEMGSLMMGLNDHTATDHLHELVGRSRLNQFVDDSGVADPDVLKPLLSVNEQSHLFYSVTLASAESFINGTEAFQTNYVQNTLVPLGPTVTNTESNTQLLSTGSWQASPMDVCKVMSKLRQYPDGTAAKKIVNRAMGAQVRQPYISNEWDRVWYIGGELSEVPYEWHVHTRAWVLENAGEDAWIVVTMADDPNGGIDFLTGRYIQSLNSRMLQLAAE